jgi:hypothetical protein
MPCDMPLRAFVRVLCTCVSLSDTDLGQYCMLVQLCTACPLVRAVVVDLKFEYFHSRLLLDRARRCVVNE